MAYLNENIAGTAMAASYGSQPTAAGNYQPDGQPNMHRTREQSLLRDLS